MTNQLIKSLCILLLATNVVAGGDDRDSGPVESLDEVVAFDPCTDESGDDTVYTSLILSGDGFIAGERISAQSGTEAIVASYNFEKNTLVYFQFRKQARFYFNMNIFLFYFYSQNFSYCFYDSCKHLFFCLKCKISEIEMKYLVNK